MEDIHSTIAEGGRIVIPADYRRALGLKVGDEVILRMADGEVHILTRRQAIKKAQAFQLKSQAYDWFAGEKPKIGFVENDFHFRKLFADKFNGAVG